MPESLAQYANIVGFGGVLSTLSAYFMLNMNKLPSTSLVYLCLNCLGSTLLLFSLMFYWNLSSVIIETSWISISLMGIYRSVRRNKQAKPNNLYLIQDYEKTG